MKGHKIAPEKKEQALAIFQTQRTLISDYYLTDQIISSHLSLPLPDPNGPEGP